MRAISVAATAPAWRILLAQTRAGLTTYWRVPAFGIFSVVLPIMFFAFFGLPYAHQTLAGGVSVGAYLMGSFGAYAVSSVLVFNVGINVSQQRAQKLDLLERATPLPGFVAIAARVLCGLALALVSLLVLFAFAAVAGGVRMDAGRWLDMAVRLLLGALPLLGLGLAIGYGAGPNAAPALANLIYLPMSFASGLFIPLKQMPDFVRQIGPFLPTYHYGQLAWGTVGAADESLGWAVLWLVGWGLVLFALAIRFYRRDQQRKFA